MTCLEVKKRVDVKDFDSLKNVVAADIVFDYRQKATRTFEYLQGDYYIAPLFLVSLFLVHVKKKLLVFCLLSDWLTFEIAYSIVAGQSW
jgi:hypothetical protein